MVNTLRLSPLDQLPSEAAPAHGVNPAALACFAILTIIFALVLGVHLFGDPSGGQPQLTVDLQIEPIEEGAAAPPAVVAQSGDPADFGPAEAMDLNAIRVIPSEEATEGTVVGGPAPARMTGTRFSLAPAPLPGLERDSAHGPVPTISPSGARPAEVYARPYANPEGLPRVALVIGGLGISADATRAAIERLPGEVTLSFVPYAEDLQNWINMARAAGHEVLIEVPLEPFDYPNNNPGPATLLTTSTAEENASQLEWVMSRAAGYVGLMNYQGARLTSHAPSFEPVLSKITSHGLLYLDDGASSRSLTPRLAAAGGAEWAMADRRIDRRRNGGAINESLRMLETQAHADGVAIGVGFAYPVTVNEIIRWAATLEVRGLSLAPLSAATQSEAGE